ncbi:hypothetical protein HMPREF9374_0021 [Desmospora sp. 8437]|nr:hypothetical protein HMPREF9374_0021 [Desmospora sp. 8437]
MAFKKNQTIPTIKKISAIDPKIMAKRANILIASNHRHPGFYKNLTCRSVKVQESSTTVTPRPPSP